MKAEHIALIYLIFGLAIGFVGAIIDQVIIGMIGFLAFTITGILLMEWKLKKSSPNTRLPSKEVKA